MSTLKVGIVGLPNVGKSTLFNSLLKKRVALSANYPFATVEPNVGVVAVPDERLQKLAEVVKVEEKMDSLPPIVHATVEFVDIAGLVKGAHEGEGLGNQFLSHIREVDAVAHVLRDFKDENIVRSGSTDPESDRVIIETELSLADLQTLEKLIFNQEKTVKESKDSQETKKLELLKSIKQSLDKGEHFVGVVTESLKDYYIKLPLLTIKPVLLVYNVSEDDYKERVDSAKDNEVVISAKLEEELADLNDGERAAYLEELGIKETGLDRLVRKTYSLLDLISFLTAGKTEVRAWTVRRGTKAPEAAGVIHTDFEKGFIRVEVVNWKMFTQVGGWKKSAEAGKIAVHGKDYLIADGDVVYYRVNKT